MNKFNLNIWLARLIFCGCVILLYHIIGSFGLIMQFGSKLLKILTPIVIGSFIAFLFFPVCKKLEELLNKTKVPFIKKNVRLFAVLIIIILILLIMIMLLYILFKVVPLIYDGLINIAFNFSHNFKNFSEVYRNKFKDIPAITKIIDMLTNYISQDTLIKWISMLNYNTYISKIASFFNYIFNFFIGVIISIYILLERAMFKKTFLRILNLTCKKRTSIQIRRTLTRIFQILYAFIFGQIIDVFLVSYIMGLLFSALKITNGISFATVYFFFALIPYFGSSIGIFLITILSLILGNGNQFLVVLMFQ